MLRAIAHSTSKMLLLMLIVGLTVLAISLRPDSENGVGSGGIGSASPVTGTAVAIDPITQEALEVTYQRVTIRSGEPQVLLSVPMTHQELAAVGLGMSLASDCARPFHLVILKGDFDMEGIAPGFRSSTIVPYLGYIYDLGREVPEMTGIRGSRDGSLFKLVLGDPTLPDTDVPDVTLGSPTALDGDQYMPCDNPAPGEEWPGAPAPPTTVATPGSP